MNVGWAFGTKPNINNGLMSNAHALPILQIIQSSCLEEVRTAIRLPDQDRRVQDDPFPAVPQPHRDTDSLSSTIW